MSMKESENVDGEDETYVKIDADSKKKTIRWKSLKEMKEYLQSEFKKKAETWQRNEGQTYLHFSAYLGDVDATKILLIEDKAEVNATDEDKNTPMHFAAWEGHVDVAKVLIQSGADVNAVDEWESTALHLAALKGHVDVAKVLLRNGADVNAVNRNKWTALFFAAQEGHVDVVKVLIQNGADVNAVDEEETTALHKAVKYGYICCTLQLLCFGAEIDEKAIKYDKTELLRPIENRLTLLRNGKRMEASLMSKMERRFMWNLAYVLAVKHPAIAFGTYRRIHAYVTFHGIFMVPGYGPGERKGFLQRCLIS